MRAWLTEDVQALRQYTDLRADLTYLIGSIEVVIFVWGRGRESAENTLSAIKKASPAD